VKILVIKRDKIGDLLLTTPMLAHLKAALPAAEVHLFANDYNAWMVADDPHVDRRWIYPRVRVGRQVRVGCGSAIRLADPRDAVSGFRLGDRGKRVRVPTRSQAWRALRSAAGRGVRA
jgi:hypothetical protein